MSAARELPVGKFHGIGPATSAKFNSLGIFTGLDIRNQTLAFLQQHFGKSGVYYYWISRGIDERPVRANRIRKSIGAENTFSVDLTTSDRQGMAALRGQGVAGPNRNAEGEVQRLRDHHAQPVRRRRGLDPQRPRTTVDSTAAERDTCLKAGSPAACLALLAAGRRRRRAATRPAHLNMPA
jgi:nucleotidyltransferase/DNA polymerase involved in DNA repair